MLVQHLVSVSSDPRPLTSLPPLSPHIPSSLSPDFYQGGVCLDVANRIRRPIAAPPSQSQRAFLTSTLETKVLLQLKCNFPLVTSHFTADGAVASYKSFWFYDP